MSTVAGKRENVLENTEGILKTLYEAAAEVGGFPYFHPILNTDENLLVIPDQRDAIWLELDGREALELLARISAVQFTISVSLNSAIPCLNMLGEGVGKFLKNYPQEECWRRYIKESKANYHAMRYGGPLFFDGIEDYCEKLTKHDVVVGQKLVPYNQARDLDIPLYLRSIWWYFRLRRYHNELCIEVRPLGRWDDRMIYVYLVFIVFQIRGLRKTTEGGGRGKSSPDPRRPKSY